MGSSSRLTEGDAQTIRWEIRGRGVLGRMARAQWLQCLAPRRSRPDEGRTDASAGATEISREESAPRFRAAAVLIAHSEHPSEHSACPPQVRARRTASRAWSRVTATSDSRSPAQSSVTATNVPSSLWATVVVQPFSWMASQVTSRRNAIPIPSKLVSVVAAAVAGRRSCSVYRPLARKATAAKGRKSPIFSGSERALRVKKLATGQ
jgi:hypothetical protein